MPDWSIKIVEGDDGKTRFVPDQINANPGDPLQAGQDDLVCWNNTTTQTHQPWPTDKNFVPTTAARGDGVYLSDPIPAGGSSRPSYGVAQPTPTPPPDGPPPPPPSQWTVYYYCKTHPNEVSERGTIAAQAVQSTVIDE